MRNSGAPASSAVRHIGPQTDRQSGLAGTEQRQQEHYNPTHLLHNEGLKLLIPAVLTQKTKYRNGVQRHNNRCSRL
ncbi:unnamed protein product [Pleuronectes platessa]|uniref:Uncharacterized protein n=1 Tax=Pleuronectes platessa TaxID=8262 RepID=A0A9N7YB54_PLEPL|nr:unnamed protein product [Pleuronectes platessa]